ncbi:hypothetical protein [Microbacterium sp.]|uniref:hypothetical protein n=1 Tax=Microbacterium sp. TaxID=51671 RepID=UPI001AC16448|nr:hypothetical protein [Microbacterium sp.]MBN9155699.1 hypothetical protein [Microbacterium sp.]MBN9191851.1 hypothetical protein [Microbacterium sp.]MBN9608109.1 hypothetical protein [Actinomycetota bacterium]
MNDTDPTSEPTRAEEKAAGVRTATTPGEDVSELARHGDPSHAVKATGQKAAEKSTVKAGRGVVWVRPSELMGQATARMAGRGIDFHAELARRTRQPATRAVAMTRRAISERARRLPPITAFGRRGQSPSGATRSGIGLS